MNNKKHPLSSSNRPIIKRHIFSNEINKIQTNGKKQLRNKASQDSNISINNISKQQNIKGSTNTTTYNVANKSNNGHSKNPSQNSFLANNSKKNINSTEKTNIFLKLSINPKQIQDKILRKK